LKRQQQAAAVYFSKNDSDSLEQKFKETDFGVRAFVRLF